MGFGNGITKMSDKVKRWIFWAAATIISILVSSALVANVLDPTLEDILRNWLGKDSVEIPFWVELLETIVVATLTFLSLIYLSSIAYLNLRGVHEEVLKELMTKTIEDDLRRVHLEVMRDTINDLINKGLRTVHEQILNDTFNVQVANKLKIVMSALMEELARTSEAETYFAYHTLLKHTTGMRNLINRIVDLPCHPTTMSVLIDDYGKKANQSKFLVDFPTFLKLGETLVGVSKKMCFVNTTPPYEWWYLNQSGRITETTEAIKSYRNCIGEKLTAGAQVGRITLLRHEEALTSFLKYELEGYHQRRGINIFGSDLDDESALPVVEWFQIILRTIQTRLQSTKAYADETLKKIESAKSSKEKLIKLLDHINPDRKKFTGEFEQLSKECSDLVMADFSPLHSPENDGIYVIKQHLTEGMQDDFESVMREEGIFYDNNDRAYLLRMEEANSVNVLIATVKTLSESDLGKTNFKRILDNFVNAVGQSQAVGYFRSTAKAY